MSFLAIFCYTFIKSFNSRLFDMIRCIKIGFPHTECYHIHTFCFQLCHCSTSVYRCKVSFDAAKLFTIFRAYSFKLRFKVIANKVIPLIGAEAQKKCGGFDHAGKWETSLLMGTCPELVDLSRCERNTEWFAQSAKEASVETGKHMVECTLEWLREAIQ